MLKTALIKAPMLVSLVADIVRLLISSTRSFCFIYSLTLPLQDLTYFLDCMDLIFRKVDPIFLSPKRFIKGLGLDLPQTGSHILELKEIHQGRI